MDTVVAVTVMRVLLFVLPVCMLRECEGASLTAMLVLLFATTRSIVNSVKY